jgi:UPF0755 protein
VLTPVRRLLSGILVLVIVAAGVVAWGYYEFRRPGPLDDTTIVYIPKGTGLKGIAEILRAEGVVTYPWLFVAGVRAAKAGRSLRAGEYEFPAHVSARGVMDLMVAGKTIQHRITIVEGITLSDALAEIAAATALEGKVTDPPEEGWMLPETYSYERGDDRQALVDRSVAAMNATLDRLWPNRNPSIAIANRKQAVILASIVEKETAVPEERARIAAVFNNRLKLGMPLQADPTVVYGLSNGSGELDRPLTHHDLEAPSPYNTYLNNGLPPGAIALPSRASLEAVLNPDDTKEIYFVADGTGGHVFAKTLAEHNRNVAKWRRVQKQQTQ